MPSESKPKLIAVVGPTASGKTSLALELARRFNGEIISVDSRQFYKGTDIGTDIIAGEWVKRDGRRVYLAEGVPHHLVAFRRVSQPVTMTGFRRLARRKIKEISARGRVPILCGGTGLYVQAVTENYLTPPVPPNPALRARLERLSTATLTARLEKADPEYAARISANNRRYLIRALEVIEATGKPYSEQQQRGEPEYDVLKLALSRPREQLYQKIDQRVDEQIERGLVKETERLVRRYGWDWPALSGLGHRQIGMFMRGEVDLSEAIRLIKRDTRHYARRQMTWWRRDCRVKWVKTVKQAVKLTERFLSR
jgi:tRNA dimethylallyltransferase